MAYFRAYLGADSLSPTFNPQVHHRFIFILSYSFVMAPHTREELISLAITYPVLAAAMQKGPPFRLPKLSDP
jgi:hypothetical protein